MGYQIKTKLFEMFDGVSKSTCLNRREMVMLESIFYPGKDVSLPILNRMREKRSRRKTHCASWRVQPSETESRWSTYRFAFPPLMNLDGKPNRVGNCIHQKSPASEWSKIPPVEKTSNMILIILLRRCSSSDHHIKAAINRPHYQSEF